MEEEITTNTVENEEGVTSTDIFNVSNPYFGVKYHTGLDNFNPSEKSWNPNETQWVKDLSFDDKYAVLRANSEEYAKEILDRRRLYDESFNKIVEEDSIWTDAKMLGASVVDPFMVVPIGVTSAATKTAYTLATKATRLAALSAESAVVGMASVTAAVGAEKGSGMDGQDYGTMNLYAALLSGGLPWAGSILSGGYSTAKVAKGMTTDPKNFIALTGELTAEKIGGTQLRTMYTRFMPDVLQSDVTFTASSNNELVTLVSNRIDSPPMAVVDRNTGEPVAIGTTGQDFKQKFFGRQRMALGDIRGLYAESTIDDLDTFYVEVGKTVRDRANRQENSVYEELNDAIAFTKQEARKAKREELRAFKETNPTKKELKKYKKELDTRINEEIQQTIDTRKEELYSVHQYDFEHSDPKVNEAAKRIDTYYKEVLEQGKGLKVHELSNITTNRHYMTRIFDFQKIREIDDNILINRITKALKSHVANKGETEKAIATAAKDIGSKLKKLDYDREYADYSFMVPKELGASAFFKARKYKLDERELEDLLVTNIEDVVGQYSYSQAGGFAANHAFPELQGVPRAEQIDTFNKLYTEELRKSGASPKELDGLENMFKDMLGTFRIASDSNSAVWKGTRIMNSINSLTYGGGFVLNTASELGGLLLDGSVHNVMKVRLGSLKEIKKMFTNKTIEDPLVRDFILMGQFENLFENHNMMKMSDTDTVFNVGKVEHNLNKGVSEFFKYTGLRGATVALEAMVGPKVIHDILSFSTKKELTLAQKKYMARIGLNKKDMTTVSRALNKHGEFNKSGKIYDMHLDKFNEKELDLITTAVSRGMRHTVIKGDTTYLPSFMIKPNAFNRLVFQFLRYPMAASETLLGRGMDESAARWTAATMTSTFMMGMVMWGREQAAIQAGLVEPRDAKFDGFIEDSDKAMKLFTVGLAKAGTLGGASIFADKLSAISGVPTPGSEYVTKDVLGTLGGATFSRLPQLRNILEPVLLRGEINNRGQWNALKGLMPGATVPLVNEYLQSQIKENTY